MVSPASHGIGDQDIAYRRGLVLGLTMAEAGILIIFVLLLLLVFGEWLREKDRAERRGHALVPIAELHSLKASDAIVQDLAVAVGAGPNAPPQEIQRLVRIIQSAAASGPGASMLAAGRKELERIEDARRRLETISREAEKTNGESVGRQLEQQSFEIANKEGQLQRYEAQLKEAGLGKGERPCWVRPDGSIQYLFDVVLASGGIRLREYEYADRIPERNLLPLPETVSSEVLTQSEFQSRTEPLFYYSLAQNCRFFVVVYDATEPTEKELYKRLLRTVEGHFYKRLDRGAAPF